MKTNLSITLIFLLILLANSIPLSHKKRNKNKIKMHNNIFNNKGIDHHSKEYFNKLVQRGLQLDNLTMGQPPYSFYQKLNYEEDLKKRKEIIKSFEKPKNRRRLYETQTLNNLGFVELYQNNDYGKVLYALKFLMNSVKKDETKFILYPYPFNYLDQNEEQKGVENGGFFSLNDSLLNGGKFKYLQNISSVQIGKARGIYDIDVAIMSLPYEYNGRETDLFTEASLFCEFFVNNVNKVTTCLDGKNEYLKYKSHYPNKGAVVRISDKDILNNVLFDPLTEQLKFRLLIFPDYLTANEMTMLELYLNEEVCRTIKKFRELGGHIITSGKSGLILELIGLLPEGTFNTTITIHTKDKESTNKIYGCENIYKNNPDEQNDYLKELICMGYKNRTYLTQAFPMKNIPQDFESLIQYTNEEQTLYYKKDGYTHNINDINAKYDYILISKEEEGVNNTKGKIMIVNGSPIRDMYYLDNVRNMILYCMTKNVIYDLKIKFSHNEVDLPIPAGEEGVQLVASYKLYNLADYDINNVEINILIRKKVEIISYPEGCNIIEDDKYKDLNISILEDNKYLKCSLDKLEKLSSSTNSFLIEITDFTVTQQLYDIPLIYSNITYKENEFQEEVITPGLYYVQASVAALLRGTINKDSESIYPLEGYGSYFDLVLNVENKESTEAIDVNYISLIPLVTPLFDGQDEGSITKIVPLYELYYENHEYSYPWEKSDNRSVDYIDYAEISGKGVCYVADYDTPVKLSKVQRDKVENDIINIFKPKGKIDLDENAGKDKAGNANSLLKQIYFADNEKFYETAAARTSLFINTATEEGAKALFNDSIPEELQDPDNNKRTKVQYAFIRLDTYFYNSIHEQYQLPTGFNNSILISIDKYNQSSLEKNGTVLGDIKPNILKKGHYNSGEDRYNRLKPNEYSNSLREYKFMKQYDPTVPEQLKELQSLTNETIRLSHYMVPFIDKNNIKRAGSILGFIEDTNGDGSGYLEQYPSIKFVFGHSIDLILNPADTRLGGSVEIILGEARFKDTDPIKEERITISADNVAFYKTDYNSQNNTIILYFKRGLMPNENYGQPSKCKVFIENLDKKQNFDVKLNIYNLKYDFGSANLESLILVEKEKTVTATYRPFFSLPCLYMENKLSRKPTFSDELSHNMYEYELMNPYARYGGYYQELTKHTTIYASAEAHHAKRPGYQSSSSGFSLLANIGTSSIPFAEFLEHGKLAVPGVVSTSRLEWTDIWGRKWSQNLRSVYSDIPNGRFSASLSFIMTTTYELITNDKENKQERVLEWQSDESVYIRVQMKVRNTYKLYWEPTICKANQISFEKKTLSDYKNPLFVDFDNIKNINDLDDTYDVNLGFTPQYGVCYNTSSYMGGKKVTDDILQTIEEMTACSNTADAEVMTQCSKDFDQRYKNNNYPIIKKRPDNATDEDDQDPKKRWNYSPLIEDYLPKDYIHSKEMWQLTMEDDYWDDSFYKGYPFHLDDCIPNLDNSINKPHDLIAFPIFKGLGYSITYSKDYSLNKFKDYKGWWSDQLQNKDHTLIAGQKTVNSISVGQKSLLKDSDWINGWKLKNTENPDLIRNRLKNIYVCQYNQHRVKIKPGQDKYAFLKNVYQNNVVPVLSDLKENDERYTNFPCNESTYQYSPYNISEVDNRVYTGNDRDWLYFAVGLRGNARENINVILKMDPIESSKFEGITKVQDGGRFTYWQPPNGPNSYQYYDCNVNTVISKRVDLSITQRMIPTSLNTFNTFAYQLFTIADNNEKDREYTMNTYMNSHGYGDATTTIYVGGTDSTSCKVNPKEFTYVKIVFYNNAGFDWKMKDEAITMNSEGYSLPLNVMNIMKGKLTAIQYPKEYNFIRYKIPEEIEDYISLTPSQHVLDISPQFYDLTFNNILNIKDGLEGDYFYCLNVTEDFPDKYKGKLWEIKLYLNEEYFESLPGKNDSTGIHDYHLTIPSIRFGVPIASGPYQGKVFYNLGQAQDLVFTYRIYNEFNYLGIKIVNEQIMNELSIAIKNTEKKFENLQKVWESINISQEISSKIKITEKNDPYDNFYKLITVNLSEAYPLFPYEVELNPYVTSINLLIQSIADHVPFGYRNLLGNTSIEYYDRRKKKQNMVDFPLYINCYSSGPHLEPTVQDSIGGGIENDKDDIGNLIGYDDTLDDLDDLDDFNDFGFDDFDDFDDFDFDDYIDFDDDIFDGDTALVKLTLSTVNEGTQTAYNVLFDLGVDPEATYIQNNDDVDLITYYDEGVIEDEKKVSIFYDGKIYPGDEVKFDVLFGMTFGEKTEPNSYTQMSLDDFRRNLQEKNGKKEITFLKSFNISLCLADVDCKEGDENFGIQRTNLQHKIKYNSEQRAVGSISLQSENIGTELMPKYVLKAVIENIDNSYDVSNVIYSFKRKIEGKDKRFIQIALTENNTITDIPFKEGEIDEKKIYKVTYKVIGEFPDGRTLDSLNKNKVIFSYVLEEDAEDNNKNEGLPLYTIIIIIVVGMAVIVAAGFIIYKLACKKKKYPIDDSLSSSSCNNNNNRKKFHEVSVKEKSSTRNIKNVKVIKFDLNQ